MSFVEEECCGQEFGDGGLGEGAVFGGEVEDGFGCAELLDGLAAGSAGLAGGVVEVGNGDGADADGGAVLADGGDDGGLLGAGGEAVGGVLDVAAGDDSTVRKQDSGTDAEVAVGCVGILGGSGSASLQLGYLLWGERCGGGWRHDVTEAIGCGRVVASDGRLMVDRLCPIRELWTI